MFNELHDLASEFPEYKEKIHQLKMLDTQFAQMLEEYHLIDRELHRIAQEVETPGELYIEILKKKRMQCKDQLFNMLRNAKAVA